MRRARNSEGNADSCSVVPKREEQVDESQREEGNVDSGPTMLRRRGLDTRAKRQEGAISTKSARKEFREHTLSEDTPI